MCGIAGFQGQYSRELLRRMVDAIAHRGPDGEGLVVHEEAGCAPTGLGHRRLAIIDLSAAGRQPMSATPDVGGGMKRGLTLTFNGEIYNYRELRAELERSGHDFLSATDSEVLLHLYERDGLEMLKRLNGIFAFAIHDARPQGRPPGVERGSILIARDQMGVKPLYYAETAQGFLFASELKALLREPTLARDIDPLALHYTLAYLWTPAPQTVLAGVRKLEPGAALLIHEGVIRRHWFFFDVPYNGVRDTRNLDELALALADQVQKAVARQLVSDVPVGAFLSGGLDSSAVVAMMRQALPGQRIRCFTIGFAEGEGPEGAPADLPYARQVARQLQVDLEEITVQASAIERFEEVVRLLDEPQGDPAALNALLIAERARAEGIPVLLSGSGGDDLFSGYRRHRALQFEDRWSWLPLPVRAAAQHLAEGAMDGRYPGQRNSFIRRLTKMFAFAAEDPERRLVSYFLWSTESLRRSLYSRRMAAALADADTMAPLLQSLTRIPDERDRLQRMLYLEEKHFLADHNLNYTDRAGMACGVEIRVPLLDLELVGFATRIPSAMKQQGANGKAILKRAMEPYLPREVVYRPKTGFGVPLRRWLQRELRETVDDTLSADSLERRDLFDAQSVKRLIHLHYSGRIDAAYTIFALMTLELWCRQFID